MPAAATVATRVPARATCRRPVPPPNAIERAPSAYWRTYMLRGGQLPPGMTECQHCHGLYPHYYISAIHQCYDCYVASVPPHYVTGTPGGD